MWLAAEIPQGYALIAAAGAYRGIGCRVPLIRRSASAARLVFSRISASFARDSTLKRTSG